MNNYEKIIKLNTIWYDLIGGEYHKDRDFHFYIYSHYFYGDDVQYMVEHKGYIKHHYEDTYWDTYEEAERELIRLLKEMITEETLFYIEHYGDKDWDQHGRYNKEQLEGIVKKVLEIAPD
jgi:hypothetical protein